MHTETLSGQIVLLPNEDGIEDQLIAIAGSTVCLAKDLKQKIEQHGEYLDIRYSINYRDLPISELQTRPVISLSGEAEAEYTLKWLGGYYLDTQQHLWIQQEDLLETFSDRVGDYLFLEIQFKPSPASPDHH